MNFQEELKRKKSKLKTVNTIITTHEGKKLLECRSSAGGGHTVKDTGERGYGYCVDTKPDSKIYQVTKSLFISSQDGAYNHEELIEKKITHILNVASGIKNAFPQEFNYKNKEILDLPETNITQYFSELFEFIEAGCRNGGAILIHCNAGISRSATVLLAYLMHSERLTLDQAMEMVKIARPSVKPNEGFWGQLRAYEELLQFGR